MFKWLLWFYDFFRLFFCRSGCCVEFSEFSGEVWSGDDVKGGGGKRFDMGEEIDVEDSLMELGVGYV